MKPTSHGEMNTSPAIRLRRVPGLGPRRARTATAPLIRVAGAGGDRAGNGTWAAIHLEPPRSSASLA